MPHKTIVSPVTKTRAEELNNQITTARTARRSFLARALGAGALAFGAVSTLGCGEEADRCDADIGIDTDPTDRIGSGRVDRCDSDGTG